MFKTTLSGVKELSAYIKSLPRGVKIAAMRAIAKYIIGDDRHGLKHYPNYKYVTPFRSYSSNPVLAAKQRGWIFTHLDQIGQNNRTNETKDAWVANETSSDWSRVNVQNDSEGVIWTQAATRTRQNEAVGWRLADDVIDSNLKGAIQAGQSAVNELLAQKG